MKKLSLEELFEKLINTAIHRTGETDVNGHILVEKRWLDKIEKHFKDKKAQEKKAQCEKEKLEKLRYDREVVADDEFGKASCELLDIPDDCEVIEHERWESDEDNRLMKKFYYSNPIATQPCLIGTFMVIFKKDSAKVKDVYSNTH